MRKKILLVDDTETVLMTERMMLGSLGHEILVAHDGLAALECVRQDRPDLIFMDVVMPELDGIETCRRIKENPETQDIPVVMVTTKGEAQKVQEAFDAGCNDYITKPIKKMDLISKVSAFLR